MRITRNWYAPVGGVLMAGCGIYAMIGFPLDDIWHRIFGQDVTLWGPTHLMMIGGANFSLFATLLLEYEGRRARPDAAPDRPFVKAMRYLSLGGLFIGMSVYQIEFDFGVPQFRLVFQPMLIAAAAAIAAVVARMTMGRGAAVIAALFAIGLRGIVALIVGPILGAPINWFPLYLGPALVVELVALTPLFRRPLFFGAVAGLGIGTVGLWLESLWIGAVYHYPWPGALWREALPTAVPVAILMGVCAALFGMVLTTRKLPSKAVGITAVALTVLVIGATVANGLHIDVPSKDTATVKLADLPSKPGQRMVSADVQITPPTLLRASPGLADHPVLAGQDEQRPRPADRPAEEGRARTLRVHPANPGVGRMEDPAARAGRSHPDGRADLGAGRSGDPGARDPGPGGQHQTVRPRGLDPAAGTRPGRSGMAVHRGRR